jgi:hypothetical protein
MRALRTMRLGDSPDDVIRGVEKPRILGVRAVPDSCPSAPLEDLGAMEHSLKRRGRPLAESRSFLCGECPGNGRSLWAVTARLVFSGRAAYRTAGRWSLYGSGTATRSRRPRRSPAAVAVLACGLLHRDAMRKRSRAP